MRPPSRLVAELGHLDATAGTNIPQVRKRALDRAGQARDEHKAGPLILQPLDPCMIVNPLVGADNHRSDAGRNLREARREEVALPAGRVGIAGPQRAMLDVRALALETEQRVVGRPASFDRVVPDPGPVPVCRRAPSTVESTSKIRREGGRGETVLRYRKRSGEGAPGAERLVPDAAKTGGAWSHRDSCASRCGTGIPRSA